MTRIIGVLITPAALLGPAVVIAKAAAPWNPWIPLPSPIDLVGPATAGWLIAAGGDHLYRIIASDYLLQGTIVEAYIAHSPDLRSSGSS